MSIYEESHKELGEFVEWYNQKYGIHPIIIGGWAVYHYNPYFESKDIDVVFESERKAWDQQLLQYFATHHYDLLDKDKNALKGDRLSPALVQTFRKQIGEEFVDIDACSTSDPNLFHNPKYAGRQVPYGLASKEANEVKLPKTNATYRVPKIELLLLYKLKAYNDRDERLKHARTSGDLEWLASKRDKDGADIIALLDAKNCLDKVDFDHLNELIRAHGLREMAAETLVKVFNNFASISKYGKLAQREALNLYSRVMRKVIVATKEDVKKFLEVLVRAYKEEVEDLDPEIKRRFPFFEFPVHAVGVITKTKIYCFFVTDDRYDSSRIEAHDQKDYPQLQQVMDDLPGEFKAKEVLEIIAARSGVYFHPIENDYRQLASENATEVASKMFREHYQQISAGNKPVHTLP